MCVANRIDLGGRECAIPIPQEDVHCTAVVLSRSEVEHSISIEIRCNYKDVAPWGAIVGPGKGNGGLGLGHRKENGARRSPTRSGIDYGDRSGSRLLDVRGQDGCGHLAFADKL